MPTPEELQQDKDFMSATPADQARYLHANDPDFHAASAEDQATYLAHVTKQPTETLPKQGLLETANKAYEGPGVVNALGRLGTAIPNMASQAYHAFADKRTPEEEKLDKTPVLGDVALAVKRALIDPQEQARQHIEEEARANDAALRAQGKEPGFKEKSAEILGKTLSDIPMVGPFAIQLGERAGKGDVAGALTEGAGYALAPEVLHEAMPGGALPGAAKMGERPLPTVDAAIRGVGKGYQKAIGVAPEAGAIAGGVAGATHGPTGLPYGIYAGGRIGKIAQTVLPKGRGMAEFGLGPEGKAVERLGLDVTKADAALSAAKEEHSKYAASETGGPPLDPETNPAYKESLETVKKAQDAAAEAHYHWNKAKEAAKAAAEAKTAVAPEHEITPAEVEAARPSPTDEDIKARQERLMGDIEKRVGIGKYAPAEPKAEPEVSKPEPPPIMTAGEPTRPPKMSGLKVDEHGKVIDTDATETAAREAMGTESPARQVPATRGIAMRPPYAEAPMAEYKMRGGPAEAPKVEAPKAEAPKVYTKEQADALVENLRKAVPDAEVSVVGSVKRAGESAHDIDLLSSEKDIPNIASAMEKQGFKEVSGSSVVSPKEAKESGKEFPTDQWSRVHHFENEEGHKVELWHKDTSPEVSKAEAPKAEEAPKEAPERSPEDAGKAEKVVYQLPNQELQNLGNRFGISTKTEDYDFSKREATREGGSKHAVDRDRFHKDLMAKLPTALVDKLVDAEAAWDKANPQTFDEPSRSSKFWADRSKEIVKDALTKYQDDLAAKGAAGGSGAPDEGIGGLERWQGKNPLDKATVKPTAEKVNLPVDTDKEQPFAAGNQTWEDQLREARKTVNKGKAEAKAEKPKELEQDQPEKEEPKGSPEHMYEYKRDADSHQVTVRDKDGKSVALIEARAADDNPNKWTVKTSASAEKGEGLKGYTRLMDAAQSQAERSGKPVTVQGDDEMSPAAIRTWAKLGNEYSVAWPKDNRPSITFRPSKMKY